MAEESFILPGAQALEPLKQGSLDGLCGIYAIINAIRLTLYPRHTLTPHHQRLLFKRGIRAYRRRRSLSKLVRLGMSEKAWLDLCAELVSHANLLLDVRIEQRPLFDGTQPLRIRAALGAIKRQVDSGYPALICLAGTYDHYTVVSGYNLRRLYLCDSGPYRWVATRACGTETTRREARHQLRAAGAIALTLA